MGEHQAGLLATAVVGEANVDNEGNTITEAHPMNEERPKFGTTAERAATSQSRWRADTLRGQVGRDQGQKSRARPARAHGKARSPSPGGMKRGQRAQ